MFFVRSIAGLVTGILLSGCAVRPVAPPLPQTLAPCDTCVPGIINFARVAPALWRGAQPDREGFRALADAGVTTIINLRIGDENSDAPLLEGTGLRYIQIPMKAWQPDRRNLLRFLREVDRVQREGGVAFVHCQQGRDRTGYSVAAYRMTMEGWTAGQAIEEMFRFRFNTLWRGNPGFLLRLDANALRAEVAGTR